VGSRCRKCANVKRLPTYSVSRVQYVKAMAAGAAIAVPVGVAWGFLKVLESAFGLLGALLLAAGAAYIIAEVVSRVINRKRGTPLQAVAAACFVLSYLVSDVWLLDGRLVFFGFFDPIEVVILIAGIVVAVVRLR